MGSLAASPSAARSVLQVPQKLQECDIKTLEICEEKSERKGSQKAAERDRGGEEKQIDGTE